MLGRAGGGARATCSPTPCCSASSGSTAGCGRCAACCRRSLAAARAGVDARGGAGGERRRGARWCRALRVPAVRTLRQLVALAARRASCRRPDAAPRSRRRPTSTQDDPAHRPRPRRRRSARPTPGYAARGRRGRRAPPAAARSARGGQDDARRAAARAAAAARPGGGAGGHRGPLGRRRRCRRATPLVDAAAVRGAAPHRVGGRDGRRRHPGTSRPGRGVARAPRRAVPRRGAGVRAGGARRAAPAAGVRRDRRRRGWRRTVRFPARFQLVLAANPCPCGLAATRTGRRGCRCTPMARRRYLGRLSGPLLDRVDLRVECGPRPAPTLRGGAAAPESTAVVAARVAAARERWRARLAEHAVAGQRRGAGPRPAPAVAAAAGTSSASAERMLDRGVLTARGVDRVLRVAWTLADLAGRDRPDAGDVRVALDCRGVAAVGGVTGDAADRGRACGAGGADPAGRAGRRLARSGRGRSRRGGGARPGARRRGARRRAARALPGRGCPRWTPTPTSPSRAGRRRVVVPGDDEWPAPLDDLGDRGDRWPSGCAARSTSATSTRRAVAVVGCAGGTPYGEHVAAELAAGLGDRGWTVVSGGAYGIDAAAHRGALAVDGPTVAVLACGVDVRLPARRTTACCARSAARCRGVSELPPGCRPTRRRFLDRNRVIAALTRGTVVVEAAIRSGALNTAGHAEELSRTVMAVPGPVTSAVSAGLPRAAPDPRSRAGHRRRRRARPGRRPRCSTPATRDAASGGRTTGSTRWRCGCSRRCR